MKIKLLTSAIVLLLSVSANAAENVYDADGYWTPKGNCLSGGCAVGQEFSLDVDFSCNDFPLEGDGFDCDGGASCHITSGNVTNNIVNRDAQCSAISVYSTSESYSQTEVDGLITDAKADFETHVNKIPDDLLKQGAVIEMRNQLQPELEEALTNTLEARLEQMVADRLAIIVPQKVAEEVDKQLKDRGL